jgi:ATP-dependent Clp protease ATP-binding subunit ClpC
VGFEEGGQLTEKVRRHPYSIVVFDEIEKADAEIYNILLQILEDGVLTDSNGRKIDFKNSVLIMTSNIGAKLIAENKNALGFVDSADVNKNAQRIKTLVEEEVKRFFKPEFINRIDEMIVFTALSENELKKIAEKMLDELAVRCAEGGIKIKFSQSVVELIIRKGFDPTYGARPLRRAVTAEIEDVLAEKQLKGEIKSGENLVCRFDDDELKIEKT